VKRTILIAAALLAVIAAGAGTYAFAAASSDGTTISGCVAKDGKLRVLSGTDTCKADETALSWNSVGPAGAQGPVGPAGAAGAAGPAGAQGQPGRDGRDGTTSNPDATDATMTVTGNGFNATPMVLIGLSHEIQVPVAVGGGGAAGKRIHKPFNVTKVTDASSPTLMGALLGNRNLTVLVTLMQGGQAVGTTKLTNAVISNYVLHGNTETWSFVYQKIEWEFGGNTAQDDQQAPA
jgi:type VI protein secretion system component Hcp